MKNAKNILVATVLIFAITFGFGTLYTSANPLGAPPPGEVSLTIHHLVLPEGVVVPGGPNNVMPSPAGDPVAGATWSIQRVTGSVAGEVWNGTLADIGNATLSSMLQQITNINGRAYFTGLEQGIYLVTGPEDANVAHFVPFLVTLPMLERNAQEDDWIFDVHVFPKEAGAPTLTKNLLTDDYAPFHHIGEEPVNGHGTILATWQFAVSINPGLYTIDSLRIEDILDPRLTFVPNSVAVEFDTDRSTSAVQTLTDSIYWSATIGAVPSENTLNINLTQAALDAISQNGEVGGHIRVRFQTTVNPSNTTVLGDIVNGGSLFYGTRPAISTSNSAAERTLRINALEILKTNNRNVPLPGATFQVFLPSQMNGTRPTAGIQPIASLTTDITGIITFTPLLSGTFFLYETEAPVGYRRLTNAFEITISDDLTSPYTLERVVVNTSDFELPLTGGAGTLLFTITGLVLIGGATFLFVVVFKKKKHTEN